MVVGRTVLAVALCSVVMWAAPVALADELPPGGTFVDDDTSIHQGWIEAIAAAGVTNGCNPPNGNLYCPDAPVTRGQMAAFLGRALQLPSADDNRFVDVAVSIFAADIGRIAEAGITRGCNPPANDRFCPDAHVTRAQMAAFLQRGFGLDLLNTDRFVDDDGSLFEPSIDAIAGAGITSGCNPPLNDRFCPTALVTRAQMATFLGRALGLTPVPVPPRPFEVEVVPRADWGAAAPIGSFRSHTIDEITIHHAGTVTGTTGPAQFRGWQAYHQSLGWPDLAYHLIIGRNGLVYEGRPPAAPGDTATDYDPTGHLLLVVEGDFDDSTPTEAQVENLALLVAWASQRYGVPVEEAMGHRDHAATTCPGDSLYGVIHDGTLDTRAQAILDAGGVLFTVTG